MTFTSNFAGVIRHINRGGRMRKTLIIIAFFPLILFADSLHVSMLGRVNLLGTGAGVAFTNGRAYVAAGAQGVRVVDVADPSEPEEIYYHPTSGNVMGVWADGDLLYVADYHAGIRVLDVTWPPPSEISNVATLGYALNVQTEGYYAYVAQYDRGVGIFDVTNPSFPDNIGNFDSPCYTYDAAASGTYCYLADYGCGLRIVDISYPDTPTEAGSIDTDDFARGVAVRGTDVYIADGLFGLRVMDCSDPSDPVEIGFVNTPGRALDVFIAGHYAFVADKDGGLRVIDIASPADPQEVGFYETPGEAKGVWVADEMAFIADGDSGLAILDVSYFETGIKETELPENIGISVFPNPFNSAVEITIDGVWAVCEPPVIEILDVSGRLVEKIPILESELAEPSSTNVYWTGWQPSASTGSGVYLVRVRFERPTSRGDKIIAKRVVYLK